MKAFLYSLEKTSEFFNLYSLLITYYPNGALKAVRMSRLPTLSMILYLKQPIEVAEKWDKL